MTNSEKLKELEQILDKLRGVNKSPGEKSEEKVDENKVIKECKKATENTPDDFYAWYDLGEAYLNNEQYPEAIKAYKKAIELKPDDVMLGMTLEKLKWQINVLEEL